MTTGEIKTWSFYEYRPLLTPDYRILNQDFIHWEWNNESFSQEETIQQCQDVMSKIKETHVLLKHYNGPCYVRKNLVREDNHYEFEMYGSGKVLINGNDGSYKIPKKNKVSNLDFFDFRPKVSGGFSEEYRFYQPPPISG